MNAVTTTENTALAQRGMGFDLSPQTFEQALTFAKYLAESEMVPKQYRGRPGDCLIAMQWGHEIGLKPLQALQSIAAVNGKPSLYGDAGKAMLLRQWTSHAKLGPTNWDTTADGGARLVLGRLAHKQALLRRLWSSI